MPKKKKQAKNWNQPGLRTPKNTFARRHKLLVVVIIFIVGGSIGVMLQQYSRASMGRWCAKTRSIGGGETVGTDCINIQHNPPLVCEPGKPVKLDVYILRDRTLSMMGPFSSGYNIRSARNFADAIVRNLGSSDLARPLGDNDTKFALGFMDNGEENVRSIKFEKTTLDAVYKATGWEPWDIDTPEYYKLPRGSVNPDMTIKFVDLYKLLELDTRPHVQNLFLFITDGDGANGVVQDRAMLDDIRKRGNRTLAYRLSPPGPVPPTEAYLLGGPRGYTGNIWTSDVIDALDFGHVIHPHPGNFPQGRNPNLQGLLDQLKTCPSGTGNNGNGTGNKGTGNNGDGSGTGGSGSGTGRSGTGSGQRGSGSGGGGTSATRQGDSSNPLPKSSPQGTKQQDPPKQEPSPFFDGKLYGIGSDPDAQSPVDLVRSPSKILKNVWFYVIVGTMLLAGGVGAGYWFWWRKRER